MDKKGEHTNEIVEQGVLLYEPNLPKLYDWAKIRSDPSYYGDLGLRSLEARSQILVHNVQTQILIQEYPVPLDNVDPFEHVSISGLSTIYDGTPFSQNPQSNYIYPPDTEVLEVLNQTGQELRNRIKSVYNKSLSFQLILESIRQVKKAALGASGVKPKTVMTPVSLAQSEAITLSTYESKVRTTDLSLGQPKNPQNNPSYSLAADMARRVGISASEEKTVDEDREVSEVIKEAEITLGNSIKECFYEMLECGEKFEYAFAYDINSGLKYHLTKNDISRLKITHNPGNFSQMSLSLDGAFIELPFQGVDNLGFLTAELVLEKFKNSISVREAYLYEPEKYLALAAKTQVCKNFAHYLSKLKEYLSQKSVIDGFLNNGEWDRQMEPEKDLVPKIYDLDIKNLRLWMQYDVLLRPSKYMLRTLAEVCKFQLAAKTKIKDSADENSGDFILSLIERMGRLNLIQRIVSTDENDLENFNSLEGYEDSITGINYAVTGAPELIAGIERLSFLPYGEIETYCKEYTLPPKSSISNQGENVDISSLSYVRTSTFGDQNEKVLRLNAIEFGKLDGIVIEDSDGRVLNSEEYSILYNEYSGHYIVLFKDKSNLSDTYRYRLLMEVPKTKNVKEMMVKRESIDLFEIKRYLSGLGWARGAEVIRKLDSNLKESINIDELIDLLKEEGIYGFNENSNGPLFDQEGKILLQCQPAKRLLSDIISYVRGVRTFPMSVATKLGGKGFKDKNIAFFTTNHEIVLALKEGGSLRRMQSAFYDLTPETSVDNVVERLEKKVSTYFDEIIAASIDPELSLPTKHIDLEERERIEATNNRSQVMEFKAIIYGVIRKDLKMTDEEFERYISQPKTVNPQKDSDPIMRMVAALELYHQYVLDDSHDKERLGFINEIVETVIQDEVIYNEYLTNPVSRLKLRFKSYFGKNIASMPVVLSTARRLNSMLATNY